MRCSRRIGLIALFVLVASGCAPKRVPAPQVTPPPPPTPKENVFVLLEGADGKAGRIVVATNGGEQEISQPNQAVQVERSDLRPGNPYAMDKAEIERLFGAALRSMPAAQIAFVLYFDEGTDQLNNESLAKFPAILAAIAERRSTAVSVTGHTDTTGDRQSNYLLGMSRAERVAGVLKEKGVAESNLFVTSHGEGDLLVKTRDGRAEPRNRRVEVVVR